MKVLHTSDLHIGKAFAKTQLGLTPEKSGQWRDFLLQALQFIMSAANERDADLVIIAGDLFDSRLPDVRDVNLVSSYLAGRRPVVVVPGNHDPAVAGSPYRSRQFPGNVQVLADPEWQSVDVAGARIVGIGYDPDKPGRNVMAELTELLEPSRDQVTIVIAHAVCEGHFGEINERYFPFRLEDIRALHADYIALGHPHRGQAVADRPLACYSGAPELVTLLAGGGPGTALWVEITGSQVTAEPLITGKLSYVEHGLSLDAIESHADLAGSLAGSLDLTPHTIARAVLKGLCHWEEPIDTDALAAELCGPAFALMVENETTWVGDTPEPDSHTVKGEVWRIFTEEMQSAADDAARRRLDLAREYALLALDGRLKPE